MVWSVVVNVSQSVVGLWRSYSGMVCSGECISEYANFDLLRNVELSNCKPRF